MKKIISSVSVLLAVALIAVTFVACGGNKDDNETTTDNTQNAQQVNSGYSAEVTENSVKVYKDNVFVQELTYPADKADELVLAFAQNHIDFKDMNFDGHKDICLTLSTRSIGFNYCCWIFDSVQNIFVYNETLSSFTSITLDASQKQVVSTEKNDDGETVYVVYEWDNGELKKVETFNELPDSAKDSVLGSVSSDNTTSREPDNSGDAQTNNNNNTGDNNTNNNDDVEIETKPSGSGSGIQLTPDQFGETWY